MKFSFISTHISLTIQAPPDTKNGNVFVPLNYVLKMRITRPLKTLKITFCGILCYT